MVKKKPVADKKVYQLTLDETQARIVQDALDMYSRVGIGQLEVIVECFRYFGSNDKRLREIGDDKYALLNYAARIVERN